MAKFPYPYRYECVDSTGVTHVRTNEDYMAMSIAKQYNFEVRERLPHLKIGRKPTIKNRYKVIREIDRSHQTDMFSFIPISE